MFSLGGSEFLIVVVIALLLFGPDKIPQLARTIGRFTREFNKYKAIMESTLNAEIYRAEGPTTDELTIEERIAKAGAASSAFTASRDPEDAEEEDDTVVEVASPLAPGASPKKQRVADPAPKVTAAPSADEADEEDEE